MVEVALPFLTTVPEAIVSFGQGCEGEPLLLADVIAEAARRIRQATDRGTINCNTNGSLPRRVEQIARAGLDSIRISLNSALGPTYTSYYLPRSYRWEDVREGIRVAKESGLYTTLNYLVFPGVTDREEELDAFLGLIRETHADMVQMRNLSIDPELYLRTVPPARGKCVGHPGGVPGHPTRVSPGRDRLLQPPQGALRHPPLRDAGLLKPRGAGNPFVFCVVYGSCQAFRGA